MVLIYKPIEIKKYDPLKKKKKKKVLKKINGLHYSTVKEMGKSIFISTNPSEI